MKRKPKFIPNPWIMYSWSPEKRASRAHIREAIRHAIWEKETIGGKSDAWYAKACTVSREWRDGARAKSVRLLAREHLEYWRYRAFMRGAYGMANMGDRPAHDRWLQFSEVQS